MKKIVRFTQENCEKVGARGGARFGTTAQHRLTLNMLVDIFLGKKRKHLVPSSKCGAI